MNISSQRYIDYSIVDEKIRELAQASETSVTIPTWAVGEFAEHDEELNIVCDHHHTLQAAKEQGWTINFEITEHPEGLTGQDLLDACWMDSDWYDVETGDNVWA